MERLWPTFKSAYSDHYAAWHDEVMANPARGERIGNTLSSAAWSLVSAVLRTDILSPRLKSEFAELLIEIRRGACIANQNDVLSLRPTCGCGFSLRDRSRIMAQPDQLAAAIAEAVSVIRDNVLDREGVDGVGS